MAAFFVLLLARTEAVFVPILVVLLLYPPSHQGSQSQIALCPFRAALLSNVRIGSIEACLLAMEGSRPGKAVMYLFLRGW